MGSVVRPRFGTGSYIYCASKNYLFNMSQVTGMSVFVSRCIHFSAACDAHNIYNYVPCILLWQFFQHILLNPVTLMSVTQACEAQLISFTSDMSVKHSKYLLTSNMSVQAWLAFF